jgi:DNA mismatch repair ATPase MutL
MEDREIKISGLASLPSFSKGHPDGIYIYVNRRSVKDRVIYKAVTEAYRHTLPSGKFPVAILFMTLPPYAVDVNVHPTKAEVKFREPERVYQAVYTALRTVLGDVSPLAEREVHPQKESKSEASNGFSLPSPSGNRQYVFARQRTLLRPLPKRPFPSQPDPGLVLCERKGTSSLSINRSPNSFCSNINNSMKQVLSPSKVFFSHSLELSPESLLPSPLS